MYKKIVKILAGVIVLTSILVIIGWIFDIAILKSILPQWVTMKFTTALAFFFGGVILYSVNEYIEEGSGWTQLTLSISSLVILLFMATLLASSFFNIRTGIEDLFVKEAEGAVQTSTPGRPSAGTMIDFILISVVAIMAMAKNKKLKRSTSVIGWIVSALGAIAILGYIFNMSALYYSLEGLSSAMAVHTAILFLLIGVGFILIGRSKKVNNI